MMVEQEVMKIRPRLRIGAAGQMTFLAGTRAQVERSHRRAIGIGPKEEEAKREEMLESLDYHPRYLALGCPQFFEFRFGADLTEWICRLDEPGDPRCMSRNMSLALKLLKKL
ncbi:hypothetical protein A2397_02200 [Candidatus Amesbacteria bacterium RIFOXYB1_FULL_44_23]|uniref:Uncharacterized protein n=1 Tax=Candidatus Amesbacteria bacterium RIFOXYB1_FULL_44_23 TaxID=1797263 RepID=A0A1F4ZUE2_9BACT|nr:MAG: hypothetical protein A2397_02200 [Candidatus Amesbacteria bacterium RIFOXYB1_FULL_44_23]